MQPKQAMLGNEQSSSIALFTTVITAGGLIIRFLDACSAFSAEAKSLKIRLDWDIRVFKVLNDYFA